MFTELIFTVSVPAAAVTYCPLTFWQRKVTLEGSVVICNDLLWTVGSVFWLHVGRKRLQVILLA